MVDKVGVATIMRLTTPMVGCIALPAAMGMAYRLSMRWTRLWQP